MTWAMVGRLHPCSHRIGGPMGRQMDCPYRFDEEADYRKHLRATHGRWALRERVAT